MKTETATRRALAPKLSIIVIAYNMSRAIPRTIQSLLPPYQQFISISDVEILIVENGSRDPLDKTAVEAASPNISYHYLEDAPGSPARAVNFGVEMARGEVVAIMVDGAHLASPALLHFGLKSFFTELNPVVTAPRFFLGPDSQVNSVHNGYDEETEDELLQDINWPDSDGYRLFEISTPYRYDFPTGPPKLFWFVRQFESNCLFLRKSFFYEIGECDERFDFPGGGCLMPDLYRRACEAEGASIVQLLGEATFHQIHGGITTNTTRAEQNSLWKKYTDQYKAIRGRDFDICRKPQLFVGHMPHKAAAKLMLTG